MTRLTLAAMTAMAAMTFAACGGTETERTASAAREPEPAPASLVTTDGAP